MSNRYDVERMLNRLVDDDDSGEKNYYSWQRDDNYRQKETKNMSVDDLVNEIDPAAASAVRKKREIRIKKAAQQAEKGHAVSQDISFRSPEEIQETIDSNGDMDSKEYLNSMLDRMEKDLAQYENPLKPKVSVKKQPGPAPKKTSSHVKKLRTKVRATARPVITDEGSETEDTTKAYLESSKKNGPISASMVEIPLPSEEEDTDVKEYKPGILIENGEGEEKKEKTLQFGTVSPKPKKEEPKPEDKYKDGIYAVPDDELMDERSKIYDDDISPDLSPEMLSAFDSAFTDDEELLPPEEETQEETAPEENNKLSKKEKRRKNKEEREAKKKAAREAKAKAAKEKAEWLAAEKAAKEEAEREAREAEEAAAKAAEEAKASVTAEAVDKSLTETAEDSGNIAVPASRPVYSEADELEEFFSRPNPYETAEEDDYNDGYGDSGYNDDYDNNYGSSYDEDDYEKPQTQTYEDDLPKAAKPLSDKRPVRKSGSSSKRNTNSYLYLGAVVCLFAIIGIITVIILLAKAFTGAIGSSTTKDRILTAVYPAAVGDISEFDSSNALADPDKIATAAFDIIMNDSESLNVNNGNVTVSKDMINNHVAKLYGKGAHVSEDQSVELSDFTIEYSENSSTYTFPVKPLHYGANPVLNKVTSEKGIYTAEVVYTRDLPDYIELNSSKNKITYYKICSYTLEKAADGSFYITGMKVTKEAK